jgi:hypothetical protein
MGALEDLLPEEITRESKQFGDSGPPDSREFVLPYFHALAAITIATNHDIAILGVDSHGIRRDGLATLGLSDASSAIKFDGDWRTYVLRLNAEATKWVTEHRLLENHGYILTSASKEEFKQLNL